MTQSDANDWGDVSRAPLSARFPDIAGKSVLITGGGSGIGAALTEGFLAQGAKVAFLDIADAASLCDRLEEKYRIRPVFQRCDVADTGAMRSAIDSVVAQNGPVEILINCAANDQRHTTQEVTEEFWAWSMDINLKAYFFAAQTVIGPMKASGAGVIINFSSVAYMMGLAGFPCYAAANAGIVSLTHSLAREFGANGLRVNAIAPGLVLTGRQKKLWLTPDSVANHVRNQCLPNPLVPDDLVGSALFLASGASRMMTGQTLIVDGGLIARA
jgi:galactose dehydrogenase